MRAIGILLSSVSSLSETSWPPPSVGRNPSLKGLHVHIWVKMAVLNKPCIMIVPLKFSFQDNFHVKALSPPASFTLSVCSGLKDVLEHNNILICYDEGSVFNYSCLSVRH